MALFSGSQPIRKLPAGIRIKASGSISPAGPGMGALVGRGMRVGWGMTVGVSVGAVVGAMVGRSVGVWVELKMVKLLVVSGGGLRSGSQATRRKRLRMSNIRFIMIPLCLAQMRRASVEKTDGVSSIIQEMS